jgi:formate-dependent nitrite reductase cytochrome c552 subunit
MAATVAGGTRYTIHDHMFDFSQPEVACGECHEQGDERLAKTPTHAWAFEPVRFPQPLTLEQNCVRCHGDKAAAWIQEKLKSIKRRL